MMLYIPLIVGALLGSLVLFLTIVFLQSDKSKIVLYAPVILGLILSISSLLYGYIFIRGFEGATYIFASFPLLIFSICSLVFACNKVIK